jgi:hypothetical protein
MGDEMSWVTNAGHFADEAEAKLNAQNFFLQPVVSLSFDK